MADLAASLTRLAKPFFDQKVEKVFVTVHCDRLFVGRFAAKRCRVCASVPKHLEMTSLSDAAEIAGRLV